MQARPARRQTVALLGVSWSILAMVLLGALVFVLAGCGKREAPAARPAYIVADRVRGESMLPTFGVDEPVLLELCAFSDLRNRDTVVFWHAGARQFVNHRLIGRDDTGRWQTKGDNNAREDRGHMTSDVFVGRTHKIAPPTGIAP